MSRVYNPSTKGTEQADRAVWLTWPESQACLLRTMSVRDLFQNKMVPEKWYPRPPSDLQMHTQACTSHMCTYVHAHTLQSLFSNAWKRQAALLLALLSDKPLIIIDNRSIYVYSSSKQITYDSGGCWHKTPQFSYDVLHIYGSQCFHLMTIIKTTYTKT